MALIQRLSFIVRSWLNALFNRAADPVAEIESSYERLRDELQGVNRGIADPTIQKKRLEMHRERLRATVEKHDEQIERLQATQARLVEGQVVLRGRIEEFGRTKRR